MSQCHGIRYLDNSPSHLLQGNNGMVLTANEDWSEATVYCDRFSDPWYTLPLAALCARFAAFDAVLLHGSFVDWEGNGIVFTGPSGIGKTTQAKLWEKYEGADIVNGDKVFLRMKDRTVYGFGSPWKGSSPYCLNRKAPLKAIIALRQGPHNSLRKLSSLETMEFFVPYVFLPHWDENAVTQALETLDRIVRQVPVCLLECRPDADAVKLVRDALTE
ncbi:MAG: hypothetical protein ACI3XR_09300 [Eubacteriales bacterium]